MTHDEIVDEVLRREGWPKYTDDPADRGGPTKGGITLEAWRAYSGNRFADAGDVAAIPEAEARKFYREKHITGPRFDRIADALLAELVIDAGVNHGTYRAARWLQKCAGVKADGDIGPKTLAAVNDGPPAALLLRVVVLRLELYGRLIGRDPELKRAQAAGFNLQARFALGWISRACEFLADRASQLEADPADWRAPI